MSSVEAAYLVGVVMAFVIFSAVLAYESMTSGGRPLDPKPKE